MSPVAWTWRRTWRRLATNVKQRRTTSRTTKRRATNRRQFRCPSCELYIRAFCRRTPEPCGVCPTCCPGHQRKEAQR